MTADGPARTECPIEEYATHGPAQPPLHYFRRFDELRARSRPYFWTTTAQGYYVFLDRDAIVEGLQKPELFSSTVIVPEDPDPPYKWIPVMVDPPEHTKWRHLLASWFSPRTIRRMADEQRALAAQLVDDLVDRGSCDFVRDFGQQFPTTVFLQILGAPVEMLPRFLGWEDKILHSAERGESFTAMGEVIEYFRGLIAERRSSAEGRHDIVTAALGWEMDGAPVKEDDVLNCLLLLFMAGLDTVTAQLSYGMHHLATHPDDRARLTSDPATLPDVVEEVLRTFPIVQTARKVTTDAEFHGCPLRAGDMVLFPIGSANRDERGFPDATQFQIDRGPTRHIAFGAGPHRCLGSHLARQEMAIALEEWHRRIPDYRVDPAAAAVEHCGGVHGLDTLPLVWP